MKEIKDVVTWLKNWFYVKSEVYSKDETYTKEEMNTALGNKVNQYQGTGDSGKNVYVNASGNIDVENHITSGSGLTLSNTNQMSHTDSITATSTTALKKIKYNSTGHITGVANVSSSDLPSHTHSASSVTDSSADSYINISSSLTSSSTQADINDAINTKLGSLDIDVIIVTTDKGTATADKMNKLYIETKNGKTDVYYVVRSGTSPNYTYDWDDLDTDILDSLSIDWSDVQNNPFSSSTPSSFATSGHDHGNLNNNGTLSATISTVNKIVVTDSSNNIGVINFSNLTTGTFTELSNIISSANNGDTIVLVKDYKNTGSESGIVFTKAVNIIGNEHIIDADGKSSIFNLSGYNVSIVGVSFINGSITGSGGAISTGNGYCFIEDCDFYNNSATTSGGAIKSPVTNPKFLYISNCNFISNNATGVGGAVDISAGTIKNCSFIGNSSSGNGGALIVGNKTSNVEDCYFRDNSNTNDYKSGGIYSSQDSLVTKNCIFVNSTVYRVVNKDYLIEGDAITSIALAPKGSDTTADEYNGVIYLYYGDEPS